MFDTDLKLRELIRTLHPDKLHELVEELPPEMAEVLLDEFGARAETMRLPRSPLAQARELVDGFAERLHLSYLSHRIAQAVRDVEAGKERRLIVEMPPRSGKSLLATQVTPAWLLSTHPTWPIMLTSYSGTLATSWGRQVRRWVSDGALGPHLKIQPDSGAASDWEVLEGGAIRSRSIRESLTGHGAKVMIIDDPHKDFAEAHSKTSRDAVWNWWLSTASTRLQPPSLVVVIMTRWHEDDLVGRLLSREYDGDPDDWERISFPAIAETDDVLGREAGDPLISPLIEETPEEALTRWERTRKAVGSYTWSALYQQRPSPPQGSIFDVGWWRYWTTDPEQATEDGRVALVDWERLQKGQWLDSWDAAFKGEESSDFVVGQRWVREGGDRFLIAQQRGRWSFTQTLDRMTVWAGSDPITSPYGHLVHTRLIEDAANGPAIIDSLRSKISGLTPVRPDGSKEARARSVSPEIESGNVYLPHPAMSGYEWVTDLVSEFREFPSGAHDDQVDALSQALRRLRGSLGGGVTVPGAHGDQLPGILGTRLPSRVESARTMHRR